LLALLSPVLGAAPSELESIFGDDEFDECVSRFAAESGGVIYVVKVGDGSRVSFRRPIATRSNVLGALVIIS
jgi:hypothetical protein